MSCGQHGLKKYFDPTGFLKKHTIFMEGLYIPKRTKILFDTNGQEIEFPNVATFVIYDMIVCHFDLFLLDAAHNSKYRIDLQIRYILFL